jgi:predicted PurR-regulated permease PerM
MSGGTAVIRTHSESTQQITRSVQSYALPVIAGGVVLAILYFGRVVFITATVSIIIALILEPMVALLINLRLPRTIATFIVCLFGILILYFAGLAGWTQLSSLAGDAPVFKQHVSELAERVAKTLQDIEDSTTHLIPVPKPAAPTPPPQPAPAPAPRRTTGSRKGPDVIIPPQEVLGVPAIPEVRIHDDRSPVTTYIYERLGTVYEFVLMASFVPFLVFFMLSWRDHIYRSFLRFFSGSDRVAAARSVEGVAGMARAFVVGNFMLGLLLAVMTWIAFAIIHVPYPFLAGSLSGFLSLVPYVGMPLAFVPPILSMLAIGSPSTTLLLAFSVVLAFHLIAMNVFYPKVVGARVHLNPLVVTFSLMFWGFLWDAPGLLLAIPITAGVKAVCDNVAGLRSWGRFLGD